MAVYACSDLHGTHFLESIKQHIGPEDTVIFCGDAGDRGTRSWETIKEILNDFRFKYRKGNHEDMLVETLKLYLAGDDYSDELFLLSYNGGFQTFQDAIADPDVREIVQKLDQLPLYEEYINAKGERIFLSHAGFTPWKSGMSDQDVLIPCAEDLLWSRDHFLDQWSADECVDCYIVHGHTPIPYLLEDIDPACTMGEIEPGALWYCDGRKCCIDTGAVFTDQCVLLDLDTWEEHIFVV